MNLCKESLLCRAVYAKCPYCVLLYVQSAPCLCFQPGGDHLRGPKVVEEGVVGGRGGRAVVDEADHPARHHPDTHVQVRLQRTERTHEEEQTWAAGAQDKANSHKTTNVHSDF